MKKTHRSNITLPEIFEKARDYETQEEKYEFLHGYKNTNQLKWVVNAMYNFDFDGFYIPKYKPNHYPPDLCNGNIGKQIKRLESAIACMQKGDKKRYDDIMTIVLESVHKDEALLLERIFTNKKVDGFSKSVWKRLYPEFFRT